MVSSARCFPLLALLCVSAAVSRCSAAARDSKVRLMLQRTPLMSSKQDLSRSSLAELLLSDLLQVENEALEEDGGFPPISVAGGNPEDAHVDLERAAAAVAAGNGPLLTPRERKAGCKNFFWKTFTSC